MLQPVFQRDICELKALLLDNGRPEVVKALDLLPEDAIKSLVGASFELFRLHARPQGGPVPSLMKTLRVSGNLTAEMVAKEANREFSDAFCRAEREREMAFTEKEMAAWSPKKLAIQRHLGVAGFQRRSKPLLLTAQKVEKLENGRDHREKVHPDYVAALELFWGYSWEELTMPPRPEAPENAEPKRAAGKR